MNDAAATLKAKSKSFYWAGCLLPASRFDDVAALYAECRRLDDAIDERDAPEEVEAALQAFDHGNGALARLAATYHIPRDVPRYFLQALLADRAPVTCHDIGDVIRFSYGVAGTVGMMMSHVLGCRDPASFYRAIDLGIAMQLTNIARDRADDMADRRDYLPPGYTQQDMVALAERYFESGMAGIHDLPGAVRPAIMTAGCVYRAIGRRIQAYPQRAASARMVVSPPCKAVLTITAFGACLRRASSQPHDPALHAYLEGLPLTHTVR